MAKYGKRQTKVSIDTAVVRLIAESLIESFNRSHERRSEMGLSKQPIPESRKRGAFDHEFDQRLICALVSKIMAEVCLRYLDSSYTHVHDIIQFKEFISDDRYYPLTGVSAEEDDVNQVLREAIRIADHPQGIEFGLKRMNRKASHNSEIPQDELLPGDQ